MSIPIAVLVYIMLTATIFLSYKELRDLRRTIINKNIMISTRDKENDIISKENERLHCEISRLFKKLNNYESENLLVKINKPIIVEHAPKGTLICQLSTKIGYNTSDSVIFSFNKDSFCNQIDKLNLKVYDTLLITLTDGNIKVLQSFQNNHFKVVDKTFMKEIVLNELIDLYLRELNKNLLQGDN